MTDVTYGSGSQDDPWVLKTPPQSSEFLVWKDEAADPPALVVQVPVATDSQNARPLPPPNPNRKGMVMRPTATG